MQSNGLLELFPNDNYVVFNCHRLNEVDMKVLQLLYQPLLGLKAVSLYLFLTYELRNDEIWSVPNYHHFILSSLEISLGELIDLRKKLEAIGLLRSYQNELELGFQYIYELQMPLSPQAFFKDEVLFVILLQKVGEGYMKRLKKIFSAKNIPQNYNEITSSFKEVFKIGLITTEQSDQCADFIDNCQFFAKNDNTNLTYEYLIEKFDFSLLTVELNKHLFNVNLLNQEQKYTIAILSYLYNINVVEVANLIVNNSHDGLIDIEKLKINAREEYFFNGGKLSDLLQNKMPSHLREFSNPKTDEERLLHSFESCSPLEFLMSYDVSGGAKPSKKTMDTIESIMINQKIAPGVVNVIIHYTLQVLDNKIVKTYVEEIAATLARKKIKTVREAFIYLRDYKATNKKVLKNNKYGNYNKNKADIIPDWKEIQEKKQWGKPSAEEIEEFQRLMAERR